MTEHIANWLTSLADKTVNTVTGKSGRIKIYLRATEMPRNTEAFSLNRLIEHCGGDAATFCAAVGSLPYVIAGNGKKTHVVIITPNRYDSDKAQREFVASVSKAQQADFWKRFMLAANRFNDELPAFNLPTETIQ